MYKQHYQFKRVERFGKVIYLAPMYIVFWIQYLLSEKKHTWYGKNIY